MRYSGNYVIHSTKQLIDINQSINNFKALIKVQCQNEDDTLDIVIVTQEELDNEDFELNYKQIKHKVNIEMEPENKQEVQNYFLVVRSDNKVKAQIIIDVVNLDEGESVEVGGSGVGSGVGSESLSSGVGGVGGGGRVGGVSLDEGRKSAVGSFQPSKLFTRQNIVYLIIICFVGYLVYHFLFKKKSKTEEVSVISQPEENTEQISLNDLNTDIDTGSNLSNNIEKVNNSSSVLSSLRKLRGKN